MFKLPKLPYKLDALAPHIGADTMEVHYKKHHQGYTDKLNAAIKGVEAAKGKSAIELISKINDLPLEVRKAVRNNGGGYVNHTMFWESMTADGKDEPDGELAAAITENFGSFTAFQEEFAAAASGRFGSGWAWLLMNDLGKLAVGSTPNQDNPLMDISELDGTPILGLDVWEHAYYLNYQNKRGDYITAFWNIVNWDKVAERYTESKK